MTYLHMSEMTHVHYSIICKSTANNLNRVDWLNKLRYTIQDYAAIRKNKADLPPVTTE